MQNIQKIMFKMMQGIQHKLEIYVRMLESLNRI